MVNVGRARGPVAPSQTPEEAEALFCEGLYALEPELERCGVDLVIEPVNRYEINYLNTTDEVCALLDKLGMKNLGVMPDVFHMNIEDDEICRSLVRNLRHIKYVHFADSNRYYPGCGHLDFSAIVSALRGAGYDGWCAVEILPKPDPDTAAFRAAQALLPLFGEEGRGL